MTCKRRKDKIYDSSACRTRLILELCLLRSRTYAATHPNKTAQIRPLAICGWPPIAMLPRRTQDYSNKVRWHRKCQDQRASRVRRRGSKINNRKSQSAKTVSKWHRISKIAVIWWTLRARVGHIVSSIKRKHEPPRKFLSSSELITTMAVNSKLGQNVNQWTLIIAKLARLGWCRMSDKWIWVQRISTWIAI